MAYDTGRHYQDPAYEMHLKPTGYVETSSIHSGLDDNYYKPVATSPYTDAEVRLLESRDGKLKYRIRVLKIVSRILATILSAATVAPLAITLVKFFRTRNQYFSVDGQERTAWAIGSIPIYTYVYFGVSTVSFLFNAAILISYLRGVREANKTAKVAGVWSTVILVAHVLMWIGSVAYYRYGKHSIDGNFKDLWGWTCSSAADEIQPQVPNINFAKYCEIQVS